MKNAKMILNMLIYPPKWILFPFSAISFASLIVVFAIGKTESVPAYMIYCMSAYSLCILTFAAPIFVRKFKFAMTNNRIMRKAANSHLFGKYISDIAFRGSINVYQGVIINFFYVVFRIAAGIRYQSAWFISIAVYMLIYSAKRRKVECFE